jgi:hypothetical protein
LLTRYLYHDEHRVASCNFTPAAKCAKKALLVGQGGSKRAGSGKAGRIIHAGALATGFLGGIVHVVCVALMFLCRMVDLSAGTLPQPLLDFALWLVLPVSVLFMPVYYAMCIALLAAVLRGRTCLPRWAAVLNPLMASLIFNALPYLLPRTAFVNALAWPIWGLDRCSPLAVCCCCCPKGRRMNEAVQRGRSGRAARLRPEGAYPQTVDGSRSSIRTAAIAGLMPLHTRGNVFKLYSLFHSAQM